MVKLLVSRQDSVRFSPRKVREEFRYEKIDLCSCGHAAGVYAHDGAGVGPGRTSDCWDIGGGDAEQHGEGGRAVDSGDRDACVCFELGGSNSPNEAGDL